MSDMFGSAVGHSQADKDMAALAMNQAQIQHLQTQDAMAPFSAQQRSAQSRWLNVRSGEKEQDALNEKAIAARMAGMDPAEIDRDNPARTVADIALDLKMPVKAMKAGAMADQSDQRRAAAETNEARQALITARTGITNKTILSQDVRGADSPEALQAVLQAYTRRTGENLGMLDRQGNLLPQYAENWEAVRDKIQESALTEKDRLTNEYRNSRLEQIIKDLERKKRKDDFYQDLGNVEAREAARSRGRGVKVGADVLAKQEGATLGANYVKSEFVISDDAQAKILGRKVAETAAQIRAKNPALTPTEATEQATKSLENQGLFEGLQRKPAQANQNRPLSLPVDATGKPDKTKLKTGYYYSDGNGVRQWLGDKWGGHRTKGKVTGAGPSASAADTDVAAADDLEDEEADQLAMADD